MTGTVFWGEQCRFLWDSRQARFNHCILPFLAAIPFFISVLVVTVRLLRPLSSYFPLWTKPFIQRQGASDKGSLIIRGGHLPKHMVLLLISSGIGFVSEILRAALPSLDVVGFLPVTAWVVAGFLILLGDRSTAPLGPLIIFFSIFVTRITVVFLTYTRYRFAESLDVLVLCISACACFLILRLPLQGSEPYGPGVCNIFEPPTSRLRSPEEALTPWQFMSISWMAPLISIGSTRQLHSGDVWKLPFEFQHKILHEDFRELSGSVVKRLLNANGLDLIITTGLAILESVASYSTPVLLQLLLRSMEEVGTPRRASITYAALSLIVRLLASQSAVFSLWYCRRSYERSRGEMITMLYEKTLRRRLVAAVPSTSSATLNGHENGSLAKQKVVRHSIPSIVRRSLGSIRGSLSTLLWRSDNKEVAKVSASMGKILNMMRNDVYEVAQRFWEFQNLITRPLGLILSILLVWRLMGWSTLIGVSSVIIAQLLNVVFTRLLLYWERKRRSTTDNKLQKTTEYVEAIRHLRWYGWQDLWQARIMYQRQHELKLRIITSLCSLLISFTNILASNLFPVIAFYAYTSIAKQPLTVDIAFPALQLFNMLESSLREIPNLITVLLNAKVAVDRIEDFMAEPNKLEEIVQPRTAKVKLEFWECSFSWPGVEEQVLKDLNLSFPTGLSVVIGKVGTGKSALLQALLGELEKRNGELLKVDAMIGYCSQTPWLQSMSIRDNILFSYPYDENRYDLVIETCALKADFADFEAGDRSNIGENGIGLSGGQRARVALARALYSRANVLLLDDPLSALDHQTADFIVRELFNGPLVHDRTVILVTHRRELCLDFAIQVVEIDEGTAYATTRVPVAASPPPSLRSNGLATADVQPPEGDQAVAREFMDEEHRAHGGVKFSVYWEYIKAGKLWAWALLVILVSMHQLLVVAKTWFLKEWGEAYGTIEAWIATRNLFDTLPPPDQNLRPWLVWFAIISVAQALLNLLSQCAMLIIVYCAGRQMFQGLVSRVGQATFRFYDVTPVGRLMNRLTSDVGTIDSNISQHFQGVAWLIMRWISSIVIIASVTPTFLVFSVVLSGLFVYIFHQFLPTSQSLRRLEMVSLSPLMTNFGTLLEGLVTVRAFRVQNRFQDRLIGVVDAFQGMDHFYWSLQAWLMYRFDVLSAFSEFALTLLAIYTGVSPGLTAFVLIAASRFVRSTHGLCKQYGKLQMDFVSVERVVETLKMEQEPQGSIQPPAAWPTYQGDIVFENVTLRYAPHLDPAISDISFRIPGGSTTALLGRTGSGKSTLALSLLATTIPENGRILIDGMDIATVDRQALRSRITFLAQDPVLFPGSMRANLDPRDEFSDDACKAVIERIGGRYGWTPDTEIAAGGQNLSQGQRQLVGLARAVLRRSAVVILDEATASIDRETALQVQRILRDELKASTVITIAHRLEAVEHADFQLRLDHGRLISAGPTHGRD